MKKGILRTITVVICLLTVITAVCGCDNTPEDTTDAVTTYGEYVFPDITGIPSPLSINGEDVPYAVFRYFYGAVKYRYDRGDEAYWDTNDYNKDILDEVLSYIRRNYALEALAKQYGQELTGFELSEIDSDMESERYSYEDDYLFYEMLDINYLDVDTYKYVSRIETLYTKLSEYLTGEESGYKISSDSTLVRRFLDTYIVRADHILIINDPGDDLNENETLINELYTRIQNGEDFDTLRKQYSEDENTNADDIGYYFMTGDIGREFEKAAYALEPGQISAVTKAPYGYHIIKRLAFDEEYITENLNDVFVPLYQQHMLEFMLDKLIEAQEITYDATYASYTVKNIK